MRIGLSTAMFLLSVMCLVKAGVSRQIEGRVVDEKGQAVKDAAIDFFWRANGPATDANGKPIDPATPEGNKLYWGHVGQMEPFRTARSGSDGRFSIEMPDHFHTLMAIDSQRVRGGLTRVSTQDDGSEIEIRLRPLVRVKGTIEGPQPAHRPAWTHVWTKVPEDLTRPLHMCRLVTCGSHEARFMMSLPPGRYFLNATNDVNDGELDTEINLTGDMPEVDLGVLVLTPARLTINDKVKQSQASGTMGDYKKHYGEKLPEWHVVDARGVSKGVKLADFKGKWVLIDFWALNCKPCLSHDLPRLAKFYREHEHQRDQFEILAICIDCDEKMKSIAQLDKALEPVVQHVWGGKPLPFPVLLDPSMTTLERWGVPGYETLLVDPDGKLVEGDETVLAEKLKQ